MNTLLSKIILLIVMLQLGACSTGPAEKPQPVSITSPAQLLDRGITHYNNNDYASASSSFQKALLQYRSIDDQRGIANSCLNLSKTYMATNNNQTASLYLHKAETIIEQASLNGLDEHLALLQSSLAIKQEKYDDAIQRLLPVINSNNPTMQLAAFKNRTTIAFTLNSNDRTQWLEKYKTLQQKNASGTSSHLARILRFEAELESDTNASEEKLLESLQISRQRADRPAIAATLLQMARLDIETKSYQQAEDRLLRALFIRHQLGDVKSTLILLEELQYVYMQTGNDRAALTSKWIDKISINNLSDWESLFSDFDNYPTP
jgi:tetratricopeptide (TPR) repeat protein